VTGRQDLAWSRLASKWDTSGAAWNEPVAERLIELTGLKPGMVTADMGCGAGAVTIPAARIVDPAPVTGIDSSAAMVARAIEKAKDGEISNVRFRHEDATHPDLEPQAFDAVLASMVVTYFSDPATALHAWCQLLRPRGILGFSWVLAEDKEWGSAYHGVDAFLLPEDRWSTVKRNWTVAEAEESLPPGMTVSTFTEGIVTRYQDLEHWWLSSWTQAPAIAWSHIPSEYHEIAKQAAFTELRGLQHKDGSLERTRTVCYTIARNE
jgi:O-methyltransferase/aklanonic acid methyltransferase